MENGERKKRELESSQRGPAIETIQDILVERAGRRCVESAMCVCMSNYRLWSAAVGFYTMVGRRVRLLPSDARIDRFPYGL